MPEVLRDNSNRSTIVMAIGVGGGGGNAVNHLYEYGEKEISYMLCNTDRQALDNSPIPESFKIQLGKDGLGAGNEASSGARLAEESVESVKDVLINSGIRMAFVVAGMGGGTGTGAAPVIAKTAKSMGILTVGIVTIPFEEEGYHRIEQAIAGVDELSKNVDSLIIINNTNIAEMYGDLPMRQAYFESNEIIAKAVKSISDIINKNFLVNVDFADVCKVMKDSGVALMGTGIATGENRAIKATEQALTSPLLHNQDITGAQNVLVCMISSQEYEIKMSDVRNVPAYIQKRTRTKNATDVIWGAGYDDKLQDKMQVIVIATGFNVQNIPAMKAYYAKTLSAKPQNPDGNGTDPQGPTVIPLDEELSEKKVESTHTISLDDFEYSEPKIVTSHAQIADTDEPFIVSNHDTDCGIDMQDPSQPRVLSLDEDELIEQPRQEPKPAGYSHVYETEEPEGLEEEDKDTDEEKPRTHKDPFKSFKQFLKEALVDNNDRH